MTAPDALGPLTPSDGAARGGVAGGFVPVPAAFLDGWMPRLRDTELRVWLVVVRQTAGWRAAPGSRARKARDWLSHSQLVRRTGRGGGAVSAAVAALVGRGLIVVEDAAGRPLATAEERRRHLGRLYYRCALPPDGSGAAAESALWKTSSRGGKPAPCAVRRNRQRQHTKRTTSRSGLGARPEGLASSPDEPARR
jgi:hypothetical protein